MSLVPSGRRRIQVAQGFPARSTGLGGDDVAQDSVYADPQQQGQQEAPAFDFNALQQSMEQGDAAPQPSAEDIDGAVNGEQEQDREDFISSLKKALLQGYEAMGVEPQKIQLLEKRNNFYGIDSFDFSTGIEKYFFIAPLASTSNIKRAFEKQLAQLGLYIPPGDVAKEIEIGSGKYLKIPLINAQEEDSPQHSGMMSDLVNDGKSGGSMQSKAANSSRHPYITGSQDSVLASIQKQLDRRVK